MNIKTIEALKKSAINFQKWIDDGLTIDDEMDETDVYPSDLFNAIATPKNILELIVELEHIKANNENLKERNRILRCRPDLPVDRLPYIKKLYDMEEENKALKARIDGGVRCYTDDKCIQDGIVFYFEDDSKNNATLIIDECVEL